MILSPYANPCSLLKDPLSTPLLRLPLSVPMSAPLKALTMSRCFVSSGPFFFQLILLKFETSLVNQFSLVFSSPPFFRVSRILENEFFKQDWRSRGKVQICQYMFMKWTLCFLVGLIVSLIGFFNNLAVENVAGIKFVVTSNMMLERR